MMKTPERAERLIVYREESHLEPLVRDSVAIGDRFPAIRGDGPREGDRIGTAIVTGFEDDGQPILAFEGGQ